jgi:error-prone DNA polymerase
MLPRLKPRCFYDLVIEVAIVRPGPIQGQMVHPYLRRRHGDEVPTYPNDEIKAVLHRTLGVPLFQEQAMKLAVVAAGFTPGEADQLRRAMGAWRKTGVMEKFRRQLIDGMRANGLSDQFAEQVFTQIRGFGEYGFPESHAASFALLVYTSAWLKCYYPAAFTAALLNSLPMGFYAPAQLVADARQQQVPVAPVDVNYSDADCTLEANPAPRPSSARGERAKTLRLGFRLIAGLKATTSDTIMAARRDGPFTSMQDLIRRTKLSRPELEILADADAFGSLTLGRRQALWHAMAQSRNPKAASLFADVEVKETNESLPMMSAFEQVITDYRTTGLSLKGHPMQFFRHELQPLRVALAETLITIPHGRRITVAGIVILRQRPATAKGITFCTLEDETGTFNLVVKPQIWERFGPIVRGSQAWVAHGVLERKESVIHVVVDRIEDLSKRLGAIRLRSRDFQ